MEQRVQECGNSKEVSWKAVGRVLATTLCHIVQELKMTDGDVVVVPKMPSPRQFTIARVSGVYFFEVDTGWGDDFGHIIPISPQSVATFNYDSNKDTKEVSDYFGHGGDALTAISHCRSQRVIKSCLNLLRQSTP